MLPSPRDLAVVLLCATTVSAVALSDIILGDDVPAELPPGCARVFTSQISGCSRADLSGGNPCSSACEAGVIQLGQDVLEQCANVQVSDSSVLGFFLLGEGPQLLCPGINTKTTASSRPPPATSTSLVIGSATLIPSEPATTASRLIFDTSTPPVVTSTVVSTTPSIPSTFAISPSASSATSSISLAQSKSSTLVISSSSTVASTTVASTTEASTTTSSSSETSVSALQQAQGNTDTGGGSPFDVVAGQGPSYGSIVGRLIGLTILLLAWNSMS